jgi:hypothetical protein
MAGLFVREETDARSLSTLCATPGTVGSASQMHGAGRVLHKKKAIVLATEAPGRLKKSFFFEKKKQKLLLIFVRLAAREHCLHSMSGLSASPRWSEP